MENEMMKKCGCGCMHHKMIPVLIVVFGLLFLLRAYDMIAVSTLNILWPIIVILAGVMKLTSGMCKCCGSCAMPMHK